MNHRPIRVRLPKLSALLFAALTTCMLGLSCAPAFAVTADELLQVLRNKGIITEEEYKILSEGRPAPAAATGQKPPTKDQPKVEAKQEAGAPGKDEIVAKFKDGITWESADKGTMIGINGRIQADYRKFFGDDAIGADTFDVRRAYLGVRGTFWDDYDFKIVGDFAALSNAATSVCTGVSAGPPATCSGTTTVATASSSHLDEAYFNVRWWQAAQLRLGQFNAPISMEDIASDLFVDFNERSMGNPLVPGKIRGAMVHGAPVKGLYYGIAYANGAGKNANDTNQVVDDKTLLGRVAANFAEMAGNKNAVYHLGLGVTQGKIPVASAPSGRTEARGVTFFAPAAFTGQDVDRKRLVLEGALAYGPVKLQTEYMRVGFDGTSAAGVGFSRDINFYYGDLNWLITGEHYADAYSGSVFGRIRPKNNFKRGSGWGAWELGLRYSNWDGGDFTQTNPAGTGVIPAGGTNKADAWTLGLKWIPNPNTRFVLNYIETKFGSPLTVTPSAPGVATVTDKEKAITLRGQFDF
jgi:phosphate-selective porin OprO and OprP